MDILAQEQIKLFGFTDIPNKNINFDSDEFTMTDALYLSRLCQYENEYQSKFLKLDQLKKHSVSEGMGDHARFVDFKEASMHPQVS